MDKRRQTVIVKVISLVALFVILITCVIALGYRSVLKYLYPLKETEIISHYSAEYGLEPSLLYAIVKTESGFDDNAKANANALGLTQITPQTSKWLQTKTGEDLPDLALLNADTSVKYGALFLRMLIDEFGNTNTAIAAYHAGRGRVNSWLNDPKYSKDGKTLEKIPSQDTSHYVKKVIKAINIYENLYKI
jgi:soluble lytic murein transglycosylase